MRVLIINNPKDTQARTKIVDAELFIRSRVKDPEIIYSFQLDNFVDFLAMNQMLFDYCDAAYFVGNWFESRSATQLLEFLEHENKPIFKANGGDWIAMNEFLSRLSAAIERASGLTFNDLGSQSRDQGVYYARLIFLHFAQKESISDEIILSILNRNASILNRYPEQFDRELRLNKEFSSFYRRVKISINAIIPYRFKSFNQCGSCLIQLQGCRELSVSR
jgi:hypothetical protein